MDINSLDILANLRKAYEEYAFICECGLNTLMARLNNLRKEMERSDGYNIIDSIECRIKTFESTYEKLGRRGLPMTAESIRSFHDIAGVRITTPFCDDIEKVAETLTHQKSLEVIQIKDYISNPKDNGYMSFHVIVTMKIYLFDSEYDVPVEIQIRDKSMDYWATLEHIIRYKNPKTSPETEEKFKRIADILNSLSTSAMDLRDASHILAATEYTKKFPVESKAILMPGPKLTDNEKTVIEVAKAVINNNV